MHIVFFSRVRVEKKFIFFKIYPFFCMLAPIHKDHNFKIEISLVLEMLQTENSDNWLKIVNRRCTAQIGKRHKRQ